jgi:hypothetical protein
LGGVKAIYRNLRENYEFIREMELKRNYREIPLYTDEGYDLLIIKNRWFRRNLFSLTGWYYHLSRYGEDILRPTLAGAVIVFLSTLFWITQSRPTLEPVINFTNIDPEITNHTSFFIYFRNATNSGHLLKAFERSIAGFIPLLPMGNNVAVGAIDYVIKIVGGAVTFGLIAIALRRKFERRFRHSPEFQ